MSSNPLEIIQKLYADFASGDIPSILASLDTNIKWTEAEGFPYGGTYTGPDDVTQNVFMKLGTEWDSWQAVPREFVASGEKVIALGKYSGTYKATGKPIEVDFAHVWTLRDGKAVRFMQYTDTLLVQKALQN